MERGYVKLWRKTLDSGLLTNGPALQLFTWLMLNATHKPRKLLYGGQIVELQPGQCIFGRDKVSDKLKMTVYQIRTALDILKKLEIITNKTTNKFSIISLVNWATYQDDGAEFRQQLDQQTSQQVASNSPASRQQVATEQECKNVRIKETKERGADAPTRPHVRFTPPTLEEVRAYCRESGLQMDAARFIDHFASNGWRVGGKAPMKDWKAAVRNWARNERTPCTSRPAPPPPRQGQFDWDRQMQTMREVYEEMMEEKNNGTTTGIFGICGNGNATQDRLSDGSGFELRQGLSQGVGQGLAPFAGAV